MLTYGLHITQINDPLHPLKLELLVKKIKNPKPEFAARIDQLRRIKEIDEKQYKFLKKSLPYFCCAKFSPNYRKKEHFMAIDFFTLDFDNFSESDLPKQEVFEKLKEDPNLVLLFTSPGGDGLKALFRLKSSIKDPGLYAHFYKAFAHQFANKYKLNSVIDWITHDVTRATFFSVDPNAWHNPQALPIQVEDYISLDIDKGFSFIEKEFEKKAKENTVPGPQESKIGLEALDQIKKKLNPNYKPKKKKEVFVPEHLNEAMPVIERALSDNDISLVSAKSISYGKQIKVMLKKAWAELNVFYGKKGFTVVKTTKTGSHKELCELAYQIIDTCLNEQASLND